MIEAAVSLPGVRLAVVTQEPLERLAPDVADRLVGHWRIDNVLHEPSLEGAIRALAAMHGTVDRCFGALEQLQQPLAAVRERLGITGMSSAAASNFREKGRMKDVLRSAGFISLRKREQPMIVPVVPMVATKCVTDPRVSRQISGPVPV